MQEIGNLLGLIIPESEKKWSEMLTVLCDSVILISRQVTVLCDSVVGSEESDD